MNYFCKQKQSGYVGMLVLLIALCVLMFLFAKIYFTPSEEGDGENVETASPASSQTRYEQLDSAKESAESVQDTVTDQMNDLKEQVQ